MPCCIPQATINIYTDYFIAHPPQQPSEEDTVLATVIITDEETEAWRDELTQGHRLERAWVGRWMGQSDCGA